MKLIPTTEIEIKYILKPFKLKNSTGYDSISSTILKCCIEEISMPLSHILNEFLKQVFVLKDPNICFSKNHLQNGKKQRFQITD
jgi:hypothetical protein